MENTNIADTDQNNSNVTTTVRFLEAEQSHAIFNILNYSKGVAKLYIKLLLTIEKLTGFAVGFRIPSFLNRENVECWDGVLILEKMKQLGMIEFWYTGKNGFFSDEPSYTYCFVKNMYDTDMSDMGSGHHGGGIDFFEPKKAMWAGIGEAVERRMLNIYEPSSENYKDATFASLSTQALDIFSIAGIDPSFRKQQRGHYDYSFNEQTTFRWVKGYSLTQNKVIWVPNQLVSFKRHTAFVEPILLLHTSNGAASHTTLYQAVVNGALELIERDAFMITWFNELAPNKIILESVGGEEFQKIFKSFKRYNLELTLLYLPTDFPVHVVLGLIIDRSGVGPAVCIGCSANFSLNEAIMGATKEALASRDSIRTGLDKRKEAGDRTYPDNIETFGKDDRVYYWSNPERIDDISFLTKGEFREASAFTDYYVPIEGKEALETLRKLFKEKDMELSYVELSDSNIRKNLGIRLVMTTAPALQPLHLFEGVPYTWGKRIHDVPKHCGFTAIKKLNKKPHPFP